MLYIVETSWSLIKPMLASTANNSAAYMMLGLAVHHAASCQAMTGAAQNSNELFISVDWHVQRCFVLHVTSYPPERVSGADRRAHLMLLNCSDFIYFINSP